MRISSIFAASSLLVLAACGDSGTDDDPSDPDEVAAAAETIAKPQPGQYRTIAELVEFDIPGASEEEVQMMRGFVESSAAQEQTFCMTQEKADEGFQEFLSAMQDNSEECTFSEFKVDGEALDATMNCDDGAGSSGTITFDGTISETKQNMTVTMDMSNPGEGQSMRMVMRNTTERTGECTAEDDAA
ncbi:hypothetical protein CP97_06425 [Aurantiacibacter atlanticus]|uniref:DUF3617 domain-containing protein n=1 Tax=Aurantiacibacter atlanticus TaxID=1648404 RepID=A0A0H4VXC6_9SPHN|nr:DUF3617 domain-containing protein [Aurantiacibacter atlanticus]AKQ41733.1 hypothetical protein CP97_06425 [Aurantiacibacter atlanticus]